MPITRQTLSRLSFGQVLVHLAESGREEEARMLWREIPKALKKPFTELASMSWLEVQRLLIEASNTEIMSLLSSLEGGDEVIYGDGLDVKEAAKIMAGQNGAWNLFKLSQIGRR